MSSTPTHSCAFGGFSRTGALSSARALTGTKVNSPATPHSKRSPHRAREIMLVGSNAAFVPPSIVTRGHGNGAFGTARVVRIRRERKF
jgi:hypothetical protein